MRINTWDEINPRYHPVFCYFKYKNLYYKNNRHSIRVTCVLRLGLLINYIEITLAIIFHPSSSGGKFVTLFELKEVCSR